MGEHGLGTRVGERYVIEERLGAGGTGVVFRARDERLGRDVALKVLSAEAVGDTVARARLVREARAAAAVEHPGIVRIYDVGETGDGGAYLVMEQVRGKTFRMVLDEGVMPLAERVRVITDVAAALTFAHAAGFVHRDVKPDNLMLRDDGRVIVLDFGLARPALPQVHDAITRREKQPPPERLSQDVTLEGAVVGTPAYVAPEQALFGGFDARADQFALAVTAFEALSGRRPWISSALRSVLVAIAHEEAPLVTSIAPRLPRAVNAVLKRGLSKDPRDRFESCDAFARALTAALSPHRTRTLVLRAAGVLTVCAAVGGVAAFLAPHAHAGASAGSDFTAVLACPPFQADGTSAPTGWLGAAAASLACNRAQIVLGGGADRTLVPAELLGLPAEPTDDFPHDPYGAPDARDRALAEAARRGAAVLDGTVHWDRDEMKVDLVLRAPGGRELGRSSGASPMLYRAVREALAHLRAPGLLPASDEPSPEIRDWFGVGSVSSALAVSDVTMSFRLDDPASAAGECAHVAGLRDLSPATAYFARDLCDVATLKEVEHDAPPPFDASSTGSVLAGIAARRFTPGPLGEDSDALLVAALARESSRQARAMLTCQRSVTTRDKEEAKARLLLSVRADPKDIDPRCYAWHRLAYRAHDTAFAAAYAAWAPWEPLAQDRLGNLEGPAAIVTYARRSYLLSPHGAWADDLGDVLLTHGQRVEAASVLAQTTSPHLRVRLLAAEARFGASIDLADALLQAEPPSSDGSVAASRLAHAEAEVDLVLGRPADFMDALVTMYVDPEPSHLTVHTDPFLALLGACTVAPAAVATRCLTRLTALYARGDFGVVLGNVDVALAGAVRYAAGDFTGAAAAWRPLLRAPGEVLDELRDPVAMAFDRSGQPDLAELVDAPMLSHPGPYNGVDLAYVRAARRAAKRGDAARARELAQRVVDAWSVADEAVPVVEEMRVLAAPPK